MTIASSTLRAPPRLQIAIRWCAIRIRDRNQRGEVEHDIDAFADRLTALRVTNVAADNLELGPSRHVLKPAPVVERVVEGQRPNATTSCEQQLDKVRPDEPIGAGDENICSTHSISSTTPWCSNRHNVYDFAMIDGCRFRWREQV